MIFKPNISKIEKSNENISNFRHASDKELISKKKLQKIGFRQNQQHKKLFEIILDL